uniref:DUF6973 domain-containing protein n=1 Tax=Flavobacterium sp. TaxID=239 RepID=UPI0040488D01
PPRMFSIACDDSGGSGGNDNYDPNDNPFETGNGNPNDNPFDGSDNNNSGGGFSTVPSQNGSNPDGISNCITNIDCPDCNLQNDINNDCNLDANEIMFNAFYNNSLNNMQQLFLDVNVITKNKIFNYLKNENWSNENLVFAKELIERLVANPQQIYSSSDYPGDSDGMPFEWWNNVEFIIENFKMKDESNLIEEDPNEREILLFMAYPAQAILHIKNSNFALDTSVELVENGILTRIHNGKADAFRHAYWNAFDTAQFGSYVTKLFTDAHEWNSGNPPLESQMDYYNNQIGRNIGQDLSFYSTPDLVKFTILNEIAEGSLKYLTPLADHDGNNILPNTLLKFTNQ